MYYLCKKHRHTCNMCILKRFKVNIEFLNSSIIFLQGFSVSASLSSFAFWAYTCSLKIIRRSS